MAKLQEYNLRKVLMMYLLFVFFTSTLISATHSRKLLQLQNYHTAPTINKNTTFAPKISSQILKTTSISINDSSPPTTIKAQPQKPNSRPKSQPKNQEVVPHDPFIPMIWTSRFAKQRHEEEVEEEDLVAEIREVTSKFKETFIQDMERLISQTSKTYIQKQYNNGLIKPNFGTILSLTFTLLIPLILFSLIFTTLKPPFSLLKILLLLHLYLSAYFTLLALTSLLTGLDPLALFYAASLSAYVAVHVTQALGYALYLLLLLMYLVLVFSTGAAGLGARVLGLGQAVVGFAVGLHWYVSVLHRAVMLLPPRAGWRAHAVYATCFAVICLLGRVDERRKGYSEEGGGEDHEGKMS